MPAGFDRDLGIMYFAVLGGLTADGAARLSLAALGSRMTGAAGMTRFAGVPAGFDRDLGIVRFAAFRNIAPDRPAGLSLPLSGLVPRADRLSAACYTGNPVAALAALAASLGR